MRTNEVVLIRYVTDFGCLDGDWCRDDGKSRVVLCGAAVKAAVKIPKAVKKIVIVFTKRRLAQSFRISKADPTKVQFPFSNPFTIEGRNPRMPNLTMQADVIIKARLAAGYHFAHIEYTT